MNYKSLSVGLGYFSLALAAAELFASRRIARALDAPGKAGLIKAFGAREAVAGISLLQSPAHATRVWGRVAGDGMDLLALTAAARHAPRNRAVWGALAFVASAAVLDTVVALGLDRTTGKTRPARTGNQTGLTNGTETGRREGQLAVS